MLRFLSPAVVLFDRLRNIGSWLVYAATVLFVLRPKRPLVAIWGALPRGRFAGGFMRDTRQQLYVDATLRPTDVIINTQPKQGQTLLLWMLTLIKYRGDISKVRGMFRDTPWIEMQAMIDDASGGVRPPSWDEAVSMFDNAPSPRVFKTHVPWSELARSADPEIGSSVRYVVITRNLYDTPYSMFNHMRAMRVQHINESQSFDEFFKDVWLKHLVNAEWYNQMWEIMHDPSKTNFIFLRFEDVVSDKKAAAQQLIEFLGWPAMTHEELDTLVIPYLSTEWMSENILTTINKGSTNAWKQKNDANAARFVPKNGGKVGENRKKLSPDQRKQLFDAYASGCKPEVVAYMFDR